MPSDNALLSNQAGAASSAHGPVAKATATSCQKVFRDQRCSPCRARNTISQLQPVLTSCMARRASHPTLGGALVMQQEWWHAIKGAGTKC